MPEMTRIKHLGPHSGSLVPSKSLRYRDTPGVDFNAEKSDASAETHGDRLVFMKVFDPE